MTNESQLLIDVLIGILILSSLSLILFLIFNTIPKLIQSIDESIVVYNRSLNYQNILNGLSRQGFLQFENLIVDQPYYLSATASGYEIKIGKEKIDDNFYQWFTIDNNKIINVYFQTPLNLYSFSLYLSNIKEKIFSQQKWEVATNTIIDLTTSSQINQYYEKSQNVQINGQIKLSE